MDKVVLKTNGRLLMNVSYSNFYYDKYVCLLSQARINEKKTNHFTAI